MHLSLRNSFPTYLIHSLTIILGSFVDRQVSANLTLLDIGSNVGEYRPLGYERVYLPLAKVADTHFLIQGDDMLIHWLNDRRSDR